MLEDYLPEFQDGYMAEKRKYGSKENAKVKSPTGNEFNEGSTKFNKLMKERMAKQKKDKVNAK